MALPYSKPPPHVWGSLKFHRSLVKNRLIFFPISVSAGFHFDIVWSTWLFFFGCSLLFPSHSSLLWVGRYNGGSDRKPQAPYSPPPPPLHTHTFGFTLVLHLLLSFTPLDPSRSVEIITVRLNSECFRFSLSLPGGFPPSFCPQLSGKPQNVALPDEHEPTSVHVCLRLCQRWCVLYVC